MIYYYKCTNIKCQERNKEKAIDKPMAEASKKEYCSVCNESLGRIFGSPGIKTSDGFKS